MKDEEALLAALRDLPAAAPVDAAADPARRAARAAFVRAHEGEPWHARMSSNIGRFAVPAVLACVVGVYLSWAIAAVNALAH